MIKCSNNLGVTNFHRMEYRTIKSKFGNVLLYVPSEKMLYKWVGRGDVFECYQKVLTDKGTKNHQDHIKCGSRVRRLANGLCEKINIHIPHTEHANHETIALDKEHVNRMTEQCENLRIDHEEDAHRIPAEHIFRREITRYLQ